MDIEPAHAHMTVEEAVSAGLLPIITVGLPGAHGAAITGIHGTGVRTPSAAAVADCTCGFAMLLHIPNGIIFTLGLLSIIVAAGLEQPNT